MDQQILQREKHKIHSHQPLKDKKIRSLHDLRDSAAVRATTRSGSDNSFNRTEYKVFLNSGFVFATHELTNHPTLLRIILYLLLDINRIILLGI